LLLLPHQLLRVPGDRGGARNHPFIEGPLHRLELLAVEVPDHLDVRVSNGLDLTVNAEQGLPVLLIAQKRSEAANETFHAEHLAVEVEFGVVNLRLLLKNGPKHDGTLSGSDPGSDRVKLTCQQLHARGHVNGLVELALETPVLPE
jgi:hypothetical protein